MKRAWIAAHLSKWISEAALPLVSLFFFDRNVESRLCPQEIGSFSHLATGFVWGRMAAWLGGSVKGSSRPVKLSDWRILEQGLRAVWSFLLKVSPFFNLLTERTGRLACLRVSLGVQYISVSYLTLIYSLYPFSTDAGSGFYCVLPPTLACVFEAAIFLHQHMGVCWC